MIFNFVLKQNSFWLVCPGDPRSLSAVPVPLSADSICRWPSVFPAQTGGAEVSAGSSRLVSTRCAGRVPRVPSPESASMSAQACGSVGGASGTDGGAPAHPWCRGRDQAAVGLLLARCLPTAQQGGDRRVESGGVTKAWTAGGLEDRCT